MTTSARLGLTCSPAVGVVIATRDRCETLARALEHLCALPERPPVVVVDNGSRDATAAVAERMGAQVRVIRLKRDLGAAARTVGVKALDTPTVAFSDDDSWWAPGSLVRAAELMRAHPRLGLIAAKVLVGDECRLDPTCEEMSRSPLPPVPGMPGRPVLGFIACGSIVRRSAYLEVGGFDLRFGIGGEEHLLSLDLATAGWALSYVEEIVAHHHPAAEPRGRDRTPTELRNMLWSAWLRRPAPSALAQTALLAATALRTGNVRALPAAARGLPWTLRERRVLPHHVEAAARLLS